MFDISKTVHQMFIGIIVVLLILIITIVLLFANVIENRQAINDLNRKINSTIKGD
jgi:cell division protein FtsL